MRVIRFAGMTLLLSLHSVVQSFMIVGTTSTCSRLQRLHLVPDHGKQLVAASCTVYKEQPQPEEDTDEEDYTPVSVRDAKDDADIPRVPPMERTRSFVSRVFSLPSALRHPYMAEMVFPLVGFRRFPSSDGGEARWLPTLSNASCRLPITQEPVFGWYSPVCRLSCTDDDLYCTAKQEATADVSVLP